jgi:hypothetical protein
MPKVTEIDNVEICMDCGHQCHCDVDTCKDCILDDPYDLPCDNCIH